MTHDARRLIAAIAPHLCIAHQVRGRVRLKLISRRARPATQHAALGEALFPLLTRLPGIRAIAFNPLAGSCVVEYDHAVIPDVAWPDLLAGRPTAAADTLLRLLLGVATAAPGLARIASGVSSGPGTEPIPQRAADPF